MTVQSIINRIVGADVTANLAGLVAAKKRELETVDAGIVELEAQRRKLWVAADVDGKDMAKALATVNDRLVALHGQRERILAAFDELSERSAAAKTAVDRARAAAAVEDIASLNQDTERLDAEYQATAQAFLAAALASAQHNARLYELLRTVQAAMDAGNWEEDGTLADYGETADVVWPDWQQYAGIPVKLGLAVRWDKWGGVNHPARAAQAAKMLEVAHGALSER